MIVVTMGVCGCGKTSAGKRIASRMGWEFIEGDDLHSAANREKMASGIPLTDEDLSLAVLSSGLGSGPLAPSSATVAVLLISVTPSGSGASTCTVKTRVALAPAARSKAGQVTTPPSSMPPSPACNRSSRVLSESGHMP